MVNYIPERTTLVVLDRDGPHNLRVELNRFPCATNISIGGTPKNLSALSDFPNITSVSLSRCSIPNLRDLAGLTNLRRLDVGFGPLTDVDLDFCKAALKLVTLTRLRKLKDLS